MNHRGDHWMTWVAGEFTGRYQKDEIGHHRELQSQMSTCASAELMGWNELPKSRLDVTGHQGAYTVHGPRAHGTANAWSPGTEVSAYDGYNHQGLQGAYENDRLHSVAEELARTAGRCHQGALCKVCNSVAVSLCLVSIGSD